jgi:hypothetical protein
LFVGEASIAINSATDTITATSGTIGFDDENLWTTGRVGIGLSGFPLADLQIVGSALPDFSGFLSAEDAILEDDVAWLGLYSQNSQTGTGSGITLGEIEVEGNNKWAIYRRPTDNEGDLVITYGGNSNPGANTKMMQIKPDGDVILAPVTGNVGIGRYDPEAPLHAYAENSSFTPPTVARFESRETPGTFVFHRSLDFSGHGIDAYDIENGGGTTLSFNGVGGSDGDVQMVRGGGDVGIGGVPQTKLHVYNGQVGAGGLLSGEDLLVEDDGAAWIGLYSDDDGGIVGGVAMVDVDNGNKWAMYRRTTSNVGDLVFTYGTDVNPGANEKILQLKPDGTTAVKVLEITGADVAERFPMTDTVEPGMVVEIDPDNAGQLRLARGAYNRRVAGVVSGAGDLPVGAILGNLPGHENAPPIALSGRVWVRCDASNGPIQPGDLLTTAERPGHAMKVTDYPRAQGAIIGKAMSALAQGESGLVLVLVNLQ